MDHTLRSDLNSSREVGDTTLAGSWFQSPTVMHGWTCAWQCYMMLVCICLPALLWKLGAYFLIPPPSFTLPSVRLWYPTSSVVFSKPVLSFPLVGRKLFFFKQKSQIGYPLNLIVYSITYLKRPLKKRHRIMQVKIIAECSQGVFCNIFDLHLAPICLNGLCVYLWVAVSGRFYCTVLL